MKTWLYIIALLLIIPTISGGEEVTLYTGTIITGTIQLPPCFKHIKGRGDDTYVGTLASDKPSFAIKYDIGLLAGVLADPAEFTLSLGKNEKLLSSETGVVEGNTYFFLTALALDPPRKMVAISFPKAAANFYAYPDTQEKIDLFKSIVLTFRAKPTK